MKKQILFLTLWIALLLSGCQKTPEALPAVQAGETPWEAESQDSQSSYNDLTQEPRPQGVRKIYGEEDGADQWKTAEVNTEQMGFAAKYGRMAMQMDWPKYDESKTVDAEREMAVQVNGKLRSTIRISTDASEDEIIAAACADEKIQRQMEGKTLVKTIVVKGKIVNLILK